MQNHLWRFGPCRPPADRPFFLSVFPYFSEAAEDKKRYEEIEKFLIKNQNVDPSTFLGRQKHDKKQWSEQYHQKQIALQGKFTFPAAVPLENPEGLAPGDISLINAIDVRFSYKPETNVFIFNDPISFNVTAATRCGVMGPNGAGKSTLLKLLTKQHFPTDGKIVEHPKFTLAYFGQYSTHELDLEKTAAEWMGVQFPEEQAGALRQHLAKTSIVGAVQDTRMEALSFSQKSCIVFSKLTFKCPHLLILDEPTNFLDLESVDSLIAACNKYAGALLLVSHNRDFLKKVRLKIPCTDRMACKCDLGGPVLRPSRPAFLPSQPVCGRAVCLLLDCSLAVSPAHAAITNCRLRCDQC